MKLAFSELTDSIYIIDSHKNKHNVTQDFLQMVPLYFSDIDELKKGHKYERKVYCESGEAINYKIRIEKIDSKENQLKSKEG